MIFLCLLCLLCLFMLLNSKDVFMKIIYKILIISVLCFCFEGCKSKSNTTKKERPERTDTTDDLRDEQMNDYEEELRQRGN